MKRANENVPFIMLEDTASGLPLYQQLYKTIRQSILSGEFKSRTRLPATRNLAQKLGVSRLTVMNAYDQLYAEGYLEGKTGSGTYVASELPDDLLRSAQTTRKKSRIANSHPPVKQLSAYGRRLALIQEHLSREASPVPGSTQIFASGVPAIDKFPFAIWAQIAARIYNQPPRELFTYSDPCGFPPLRKAIAAHLRSARGVNCRPEQIIITSGTQQALDLIARIFISERDGLLIENPCYLNARGAFGAAGARLIPIPVDDHGFKVAAIPAGDENIKLAYVTPSHQYPLGVTMSLARRLALIEWAKKTNAWIIEDDYDSEFRYTGRPLASLQGLDSAGRVIYIGTFSKTIFPSLRLGCLVVPSELIEVFKLAHIFSQIQCQLIDQMILAEFIAEGHYERHIRRMRILYDERRKFLLAACKKHLSEILEIQHADAGMHLVGWLPESLSDQMVSENAQKENMRIAPLSQHYIGKKPRNGLIIGYTAVNEKQIKAGMKKLHEILYKGQGIRGEGRGAGK